MSAVKERWDVLTGKKRDPFDNFDFQERVHGKHLAETRYFIQIGDRGKHDKNIDHRNTEFRSLVRELEKNNRVGLHPSYRSNSDPKILKMEWERLYGIMEGRPDCSRQHFLMMELPATYRNLIGLGIAEEHTMGYSTHMGFRASIATPFNFFDLQENKATPLKVVPFALMDVTLQHFMGLSPENAIREAKKLMKRVKEVEGLFVLAWHNESLSELNQWEGWRRVYKKILKRAAYYSKK